MRGDMQVTGRMKLSAEGLLRPEFYEGGAGFVSEVNKDEKLNMINELTWQMFKNNQWENNEQGDNPFYYGLIVEKAARFSAPLAGEEYLPAQASQSLYTTKHIDKRVASMAVPDDLEYQARSLFMAVQPYEGQAAKSDSNQTFMKSENETDAEFHDVFLPDWFSINARSPLETFTEADGTQLPDSERLLRIPYSMHDHEAVENLNQWIMDTSS
jgi:hypothetical protein